MGLLDFFLRRRRSKKTQAKPKAIRGTLSIPSESMQQMKEIRKKIGVISIQQVILFNAQTDYWFLTNIQTEDEIQIIRHGTVFVRERGWFFITFPKQALTVSSNTPPSTTESVKFESIDLRLSARATAQCQQMIKLLDLPENDIVDLLRHNRMVGYWCITNVRKGDTFQIIRDGKPYFPQPISANFLITWNHQL